MAIAAKATRLRELRLQGGLTQAELAARAGVSRQLVAAVEAGQNTPAVDAALSLARALATTVEDLFADTPPRVVPALGGRLIDGTPVRLGRVADQLVAAPLPDHGAAGAGWAAPDGVCGAGSVRLFPGANSAALVIAGCDPALGIAETMLAGLGARSLLAIPAPTGTALHALKHARVHAAVVHGPPDALPRPPVPVIRWHLARWHVGLGLGAPGTGDSLEAILHTQTPIVQRDPAAASQQAFQHAAAHVGITKPPAGPRATGHIDAARIAATISAAGVTTEAAADAFDLRFLPLEHHTVEIWLAQQWSDHPAAIALADLLSSAAFTQRVAQFGGYDLSDCGSTVPQATSQR
jgi:DNA-binding XRE family transcriptional regulator